MDSLRRKCFDCKHCIDAVAADTLDGGVIVNKFGFYHRFAAAAAGRRLIAYHNIDSDLIHDVDKSARCVTSRNRSVAAAAAVVDFEIYLA